MSAPMVHTIALMKKSASICSLVPLPVSVHVAMNELQLVNYMYVRVSYS